MQPCQANAESAPLKRVTVYGLASSEDGKIRYVGQTVRPLNARLTAHLNHAKIYAETHVQRWINKVRAAGFFVLIRPLIHDATWSETERTLIALYRKNGYELVNSTDGGDGRLGYAMPEEVKAKLSKAHKGRKKTPEHILASSMARRGFKPSLETRAKQSAVKKGKRPKNFDALVQAKIGKPLSENVRKKISATMKQKGIAPSNETKKLGTIASNKVWIGRKHKDSSKKKMSVSAKKYWEKKGNANI